MAHTFPLSSPSRSVRDTRTGRMVEVRGIGALKGRLTLQPDVDLTKPVFEQVAEDKPRSTRRPKT